jgi:hypothetical protein
MLLREEGSTLILGQAIPRDWIMPGKTIKVDKAPTLFGEVSYTMTTAADGTVKVHIAPPRSGKAFPPAKTIQLDVRHISGKPISAVTVSSGAKESHSGESITLTGLSKPADIEIKF